MDNNDILIRLRYALDIKNAGMVDIFKLGGLDLSKEQVLALLKKSTEEPVASKGEEPSICTNEQLDAFLNGLIISKRGRQTPQPGQPERPPVAITSNETVNNILLKKLKIALQLTSEDMLDILEEADVFITKGELSAVLRKEGHKNYKECGDRYARNFLKGLAIKYRD